MGCTTSRFGHEHIVRRCKDRFHLNKESVFSRHHLATEHADYCRSLHVTDSALSTFTANEPLSVSDSTLAVLLPNQRQSESESFKFAKVVFNLSTDENFDSSLSSIDGGLI